MNTNRLKLIVLIAFLVLVFFSATEWLLRKEYGFTDAILFRADKSLEYIPIPQKRFRFKKSSFYNRYSQRNREISRADTAIILGFGDSVINGGALTDQDSLATTLLTRYLSNKYKKNILVTNISAGSWGPDNCFAYLKKYGSFGAKGILLLVSSHDAYDNMKFDNVVGIHPNYPAKQYRWAILEVLDRYVYPYYIKRFLPGTSDVPAEENNKLLINKYRPGTEFNKGFENFKNYSCQMKIPLTVFLHADKAEFQSRQYNKQGQEIIRFCEHNGIPLIKELDYPLHAEDYRDGIHLSERGQYHLFLILKNYF